MSDQTVDATAEKPPAEKCSWCDRGTWTDSNNQRRRCAYCAGTGQAPVNNVRNA